MQREVEGCLEDRQDAIGGAAPAPDALGATVRLPVRLALAGLGPQPTGALGDAGMPSLEAAAGQLVDQEVTQVRLDMRPDRPIEPIEGLAATPLVVRDVVVEGLAHGVGPMIARAPIFPGYVGEPPPTRGLGLGKGQDVLAVSIGHVVGCAEGLEASAVVGE